MNDSLKKIEFIKDPSKIEDYLTDESLIVKGSAEKVYLPKNEEEAIEVIKYCYENNYRLTISGAGTGITGSRVPLGGIVLSTENLTQTYCEDYLKKLSINENGRYYSIFIKEENNKYYAVCPPGIPIRTLNSMLEKEGFYYAPDPTETNAFLGGAVATNASGPRTFYYGTTRDNVKRLRVILPDGNILDLERGMHKFKGREIHFKLNGKEYKIKIPRINYPQVKKNVAGYYLKSDMDLVDLFIGSEGTLGLFSQIEVKIHVKPKQIYPIYLFFDEEIKAYNFSKILKLNENREKIGIISLEFFDERSTNLVKDKYRDIFGEEANSILFLEIKEEKGKELDNLEKLLEEKGNIKSAVFSEEDIAKTKEIRHEIPATINSIVRKYGLKKIASDIAVPSDKLDEMYNTYVENGKSSGIDYYIFGHIGDDHLHFNFLPKNKEEMMKGWKIIARFLEKAVTLGGTVTAEHGLGKKAIPINDQEKYLIEFMYKEEEIREMLKVKKALDEKLILNVGNIIPLKYY